MMMRKMMSWKLTVNEKSLLKREPETLFSHQQANVVAYPKRGTGKVPYPARYPGACACPTGALYQCEMVFVDVSWWFHNTSFQNVITLAHRGVG